MNKCFAHGVGVLTVFDNIYKLYRETEKMPHAMGTMFANIHKV